MNVRKCGLAIVLSVAMAFLSNADSCIISGSTARDADVSAATDVSHDLNAGGCVTGSSDPLSEFDSVGWMQDYSNWGNLNSKSPTGSVILVR